MHKIRLPILVFIWVAAMAGDALAQGAMSMKRVTPVLLVEQIEPCLEFWVDRLGFAKTLEVPESEGGPLGFVSLQSGPTEIMLQSRNSVASDLSTLAKIPFDNSGVVLYIEVDGELEDYVSRLEGYEVVIPQRHAFYGANEIGIRAPGGILVMLASMEAVG